MGKMLEVKLVRLLCDFSGTDDGNDLEIAGRFFATTFDEHGTAVDSVDIFSFPDGPIRMVPGQIVTIDKEQRIGLKTPTSDPLQRFGVTLKFGGELIEKDVPPDTDDPLGISLREIHTTQITQPGQTQMHHLMWESFGQELRAEFAVTLIHFL